MVDANPVDDVDVITCRRLSKECQFEFAGFILAIGGLAIVNHGESDLSSC